MKIIITAAGEGSRFNNLGINKPKYQIIAKNKTLFNWAVKSLKNFNEFQYIFIFRKEFFNKSFVEKELKKLNINNYSIVLVDYLTEGQAATAMLADEFIDEEEEVMIYNIDTAIRANSMNNEIFVEDGCIVVAKALGDHWSFAKVDKNGYVNEVSEKVRISDYASIGPYYFKKWKDFKWVYDNFKEDIKKQYKEVYICPMYQYLINENKKIKIYEISTNDFVCLGTPKEIDEFDINWLEKNR